MIKNSPSNSQPVARWVESIRPWMPGSEDAEMLDADSGSKGDIIARAKGEHPHDTPWDPYAVDLHVLALQFLASTLEGLDKHVLIPAHSKT